MLQKQPAFKKWNAMLIVTAFIAQFIYSEMLSDIYNTYYTYLAIDGTVWTRSNMTLPTTISGYLAIPLLYVAAILLSKIDNRKVLCASTVIVGVCTILIGFSAGTNFPLFFGAMIVNNMAGRVLILAVQGVVTNWYISTRGTVMGIYTMAAPLGTAFFPNFLIHLVALTNPGVDTANGGVYNFATTWTVLGVVIIIFGIIFLFTTRTRPDELGLYPDGLIRSEEEIEVLTRPEESNWTVGKLLKTPEMWMVTIGTSGWLWVMNGFMSLFVVVMMLEFDVPATTSVWYLTFSSLLGIVISFLWGVIDDKFGTPIACRGLSFAYFLMSGAMLLAVVTHIQPIIYISVVGIAFATGGIPNLTPSVFGYVFGRKQFMHANKVISPLSVIISCPSAYVFTKIQEVTGSFKPVYIICMIAAVISFVCFLLLKKSYDPERNVLKDAAVVGEKK
jgi:MFS transporter, OFA family, oxalate/formate antiporter